MVRFEYDDSVQRSVDPVDAKDEGREDGGMLGESILDTGIGEESYLGRYDERQAAHAERAKTKAVETPRLSGGSDDDIDSGCLRGSSCTMSLRGSA